MSATRYIVQVNGQPLVTRSRKEQAMPVYTAEAANTANVVHLITNTGKVLETNRPEITITDGPAVEAPALETLAPVVEALAEITEEPKVPVTAPETTDSALEFLKAEVEATAAKRAEVLANAVRIPCPVPALEKAMTPRQEVSREVPQAQVDDMVALTKRPKISTTYIITVDGVERARITKAKAAANKEFDLLVKESPAAIITMSTGKGNQVRYYDGPGVQAKAVNAANPDAPLVTPARPSRKRTAAKPAPAAEEPKKTPARNTASKRVLVATKAEKKATAKPVKKAPAAGKKTVLVKVDGRKNPAAPRWTSKPGQVRDQVKEFLNNNPNKSFTSVQIMRALNRDNGVNNISTALADRGEIAWASKPGEVKRFTSLKSTRLLKKLGLLPEKKTTARKATAGK